MENVVGNILDIRLNCLRSLQVNNGTMQESVNPQLRIIQMNWMIDKFYQDRLMIDKLYQDRLKFLQQLQQNQEMFIWDVAPRSPESPIQLAPASSVEKADQAEESMELQGNLFEVSPLEDHGKTELEQTHMRAGSLIKPAHGPGATTTKLLLHPSEFRQRVHGVNIPALNLTGPVEVDVKYHANMIRSFGNKTKECILKQKESCKRNNQAARMFRAKARAISKLLEKESFDAAEMNNTRKVRVAQKRVYISRLLKRLGLPAKDLVAEWKQQTPTDDQESEGNESDYGKGTAAEETC